MNPSLTSVAASTPARWLGALLMLSLPVEALRAAPPVVHHSRTVTATAYSSHVDETDHTPHHGAWGDRLDRLPRGQRALAVSPDLLRRGLHRGQHVKLKGVAGDFVVLDKTPSRWLNRVDIHMGMDSDAADRFGKRKVQLVWTSPRPKPIRTSEKR